MSDTAQSAIERLPMETSYRTHTCDELRVSHVGQTVRLAGAVYKIIDALSFDIRDGYGTTRVKLNEAGQEILKRQLEDIELCRETIVMVEGEVEERRKKDSKLSTGAVYINASGIDIISLSRDPLLFDFNSEEISRWDRVRYRYLWLRNPQVHETFKFRTQLSQALRRHLHSTDFTEVETPILATAYTPEATESFIAARDFQKLFLLPGKRPIHGDILMSSGFDRTFEFARRFNRKANYGPFQQPEFTVLDVNMAWVGPDDLYAQADALLDTVWSGFLRKEGDTPLTSMTSAEAWTRYGSEAPDLRFDLEIKDVSELADISNLWRVRMAVQNGGALRAFRVPGMASRLLELDELEERVLDPDLTALHWISMKAGGKVEVGGTAPLDEHLSREIALSCGAKPGDLVVVAFGEAPRAAEALAGDIRSYVGQAFELMDREHAFARITELPYFQQNFESGEWEPKGDPMTLPLEQDLQGDKIQMRGHAFKLSLNGTNIGGGAVRNHNLYLQRQMFRLFDYDSLDVDRRFGTWLDVLRFGIPPRGRIAIGMDRLVALLLGLDSIEEVIAMPKVWDGTDPLVRSPWPMDRGLVRALMGVS